MEPLAKMCQKQKRLAINGEKSPKTYVIEIKIVILLNGGKGPEKKGLKNEANVH
jgi:hypothetical protein